MTDKAATEASKQLALKQEFYPLVRALRAFLSTLWSTDGRRVLSVLTLLIVLVICATVVAQVALNAWNKPFYNAIQDRNFPEFAYQSLVFFLIAGSLLVLNVAQAWLREMIKLKSREWLTRDLFVQWLEPGRAVPLSYAGEVGINPDQRIQQDTSQLTELAAELGIGLLQALLLLAAFLGVLWELSGALRLSIGGISFEIPGYMVWCAILFSAAGSWLAWRVGGPLVGLNAVRFQRESGLRFALVQVNQQADDIAQHHREQIEQERLRTELDGVLVVIRQIVGAIAKVTWVTAGYGWISIIAPLIIAAPSYFDGKLSFGELMMVVGGFSQVNSSLRWFVDNFSRIAEWGATLLRVMSFREVLLTVNAGLEGEGRIAQSKDSSARLRLEDIGIKKGGEKAALDRHEVEVLPGDRVHIIDKSRSGRNPLLAALAGLWPWGSGTVQSPFDMEMMFLKRRPYFPPGSLRAVLAYPSNPSEVSESAIQAALERVGLSHLSGALDLNAPWGLELTDDEQIRIALARLVIQKPRWIFADHVFGALTDEQYTLMKSIFANELVRSAVVSIGRHVPPDGLYRNLVYLTRSPAA